MTGNYMINDICAENQFLAKIAYLCKVEYSECLNISRFKSKDKDAMCNVLDILHRWGIEKTDIAFYTDYCEISLFRNDYRFCEVCGEPIREGYCVDGGYQYFCCDECLHVHYTEEDWAQECENNDQSYWSEWESPYFD